MPWQECSKVDERLRFVARLMEGEKMAVLCREFDISRKTGHKIFNRYRECGLEGLTDRIVAGPPPSEPFTFSDRSVDFATEEATSELGCAEDPREDPPPAQRDQFAGHQYRARGPRPEQSGQPGPQTSLPCARYPAVRPTRPNDLWCADYKGEFQSADKRYCYPLRSPTR